MSAPAHAGAPPASQSSVCASLSVGRAVADGRRDRGLTQHELAQRAGVSRSFLAALEAGHERAELGKVLSVLSVLEIDLPIIAGSRSRALHA